MPAFWNIFDIYITVRNIHPLTIKAFTDSHTTLMSPFPKYCRNRTWKLRQRSGRCQIRFRHFSREFRFDSNGTCRNAIQLPQGYLCHPLSLGRSDIWQESPMVYIETFLSLYKIRQPLKQESSILYFCINVINGRTGTLYQLPLLRTGHSGHLCHCL